MDPDRDEFPSSDGRVDEIIAAYLQAEDEGRPLDREELIGRHPDLEEDLRRFFADHERAGGFVSPIECGADRTFERHAISPQSDDDAAMTITNPDTRYGSVNGHRIRYFGDFELQKELGRGGMGVVYRALQVSLNRPVAIKMIKGGLLADDAELRRFQNEAEAVSLLDHAGIVPVYEVGAHEGQRYFSMKLVEGGNLAEQLETFQTNPRAAATLLAETAQAVHHAHMRGILHRDLKPANILVDAEGHPHVTDFGLAKRVDAGAELTHSGSILGTPAYMSPEQATGRRGMITTATDVYGLGAILYAMLAGRAPFGSDSVLETLDQVRQRLPTPPSMLGPCVPRDLEVICLKCLEKDPRHRYSSADALADDLDRWRSGVPIAARPVGLPVRAAMWARRKPIVAALAASLLLTLIGGTGLVVALQSMANGKLRASNTRMDHQKARAEGRERQAIDAVKRYVDVVRETPELKNRPELARLRATLLKEPEAFFSNLLVQLRADGDTTPDSLDHLAAANLDLGTLRAEIGDRRDAIRVLEESLAIRERLVREHPENPRFRTGLGVSYSNLAFVQGQTGRTAEALATLERAQPIWERLVRDNPSDDRGRSGLATNLDNIANLRRQMGQLAKALALHEQVRTIREQLTRDHPSRAVFWSNLATTHHSIGSLLRETGKPEEALASLRKAQEVRKLLVERASSVAEFRIALAKGYGAVGHTLSAMRRAPEALASYEQALEIWKRLAQEEPSTMSIQNDLAGSYNAVGLLLLHNRRVDEALAPLVQSLAISERLVREHPESPEFASDLGGTLNTMAQIDLRKRRFDEARAKLTRAIGWQKKALAANPKHPTYRRFLHNHLQNLVLAANGLGRVNDADEARRQIAELAEGSLPMQELNEQLAAAIKRDVPKGGTERLRLALNASWKEFYAASASLYAGALAADPTLGDDRRAQWRYAAACAAAMVGSGRGGDDPKPDENAKSKLRSQALGWLKSELAAWRKVALTVGPGNRELVGKTLAHWIEDADLAGVRDADALGKLAEAERKEWQLLWADVNALLAKVTKG